MKIPLQIQKVPGARGQAIVEFALVLMILMVVLVGILEVGRLMFMYAAVNNASREASRYASAIGLDTNPDNGVTAEKYRFCEMIKKMAQRSAFFTSPTITISYDHGPGTTAFDTCDGSVDTGVSINSGTDLDRVYVTVSANYSPMLNLIPIGSRTLTSASARTISGYLDLEDLPTRTPNPPTVGVPTTPGTVVASYTPTATATATVASQTPTATSVGVVVTMTPLPSSTPTLLPTLTRTATVTLTPTETITPTLTFTPTVTSTAMPGCNSISTSSIIFDTKTMSLAITNPHASITILNIQVVWNSANGGSGGPSGSPLALRSVSLDGTFWAGTDSTGNLTITPSTTVTIPGNNQTSRIVFTFDKNYQHRNNSESIVINLATPGCESYTIRKP
jgi:Flp pilus assembly protein TadG